MRQGTIEEGIIGTFATKGGKGGGMAADGMSKALTGAEFVLFVNWNSGRQMWGPFDLVCKEITSQIKMAGTCKICGMTTVS
jgi:hypothetical protein